MNVRKAATDSVAGSIVTFAIRTAGVLLPLFALFGLPLLCALWLVERRKRKLAVALSA